MVQYTEQEIKEAIRWFGEEGNWTLDDCDHCEDGSVYVGLTQLLPPFRLLG